MNVTDFARRKRAREKLSMVTCYDHWSARILDTTPIDCLLIGDSVAMVVHGYDSTVHADIEMMRVHTAAVARGAPSKFLVADMPFLSARRGVDAAMGAVDVLMKAGANAVKIEGARGQVDLMAHIVESGIPVMGHLGLTPQSVHGLGGHKVQARGDAAAAALLDDARALADAGCFALVLECVPHALAEQVTQLVDIPTIGIGAGPATDGQVLVLHDLLGMDCSFKPRFLRHYAAGGRMIADAIERYHADVRGGCFPSLAESYA